MNKKSCRKYYKLKLSIILIITSLLFTACSDDLFNSSNSLKDTNIKDNEDIYKQDDDSVVKELYITILPVEKGDDKYGFTFSQLNEEMVDSSGDDIKVKVIFQEGKNGIVSKGEYGYGLTNYNGTMELRGQSSRVAYLKSYKINLNENNPWNGFETVNLNKHPFDTLRIRNKLSFDLIKNIPNITSLRTQFIHLYIKNLSEDDYSQAFEDFGLFTQIENVDKDFLENHNLDKKGSLYKVENFEFYTYEDVLKEEEDPEYDEEEFEKILEIKGNNDHKKLIQMLDDVNNNFININDVIDKHFNRENYLTWLSINILLDNIDSASRNYFLYSSAENDTWYFLPWDYDGIGTYIDNRGIWQSGVSNQWGSVLTNRFLRNEENVKELTNKIESLSEIISKENVSTLMGIYEPMAIEFLNRKPDKVSSSYSSEKTNLEFDSLIENLEVSKENYYKSLEKPMPVFMGDPLIIGNFLHFEWSESYDFQGDEITYSMEISDTPNFEKILYSESGIKENELIIDMLPKGTYYWRLFITDSKGNKMDAFDIYTETNTITNEQYRCFSTKKFFIS
jgi:spore coat protein H